MEGDVIGIIKKGHNVRLSTVDNIIISKSGSDDFYRHSGVKGDILAGICELTEIGIILVDRNTTILSCNPAAQSILAAAQGIVLKGQSFVAVRASEQLLLSQAITRAMAVNADRSAEKFTPPVLLISRSEQMPLTISVVPARLLLGSAKFQAYDVDGVAAAAVLIANPDAPRSDSIRLVCKLYTLTPAETRLAELLIDGLTLAEAADAMQVKVSTVRVYLKQIFMKTGVHRQPMLIRLLLTARVPLLNKEMSV